MADTSVECFGSGDDVRKTLQTQLIAFEPLPASVLLPLVFLWLAMLDERRCRSDFNLPIF